MYTSGDLSELWSLLYGTGFIFVCVGIFSVAIAAVINKLATPGPELENAAIFLHVLGVGASLVGFVTWCIFGLSEPPTVATQEAETRLSTPDRYREISQGDVLAFPAESDLSYGLWHVVSPASAEGDSYKARHVQCVSPGDGFFALTPKELAKSRVVIISREQLEKAASFSSKELQEKWQEMNDSLSVSPPYVP